MLDNRQNEAARYYGSPCLIIASPGSGKTTVIIERIRFLINEKHINPTKILVITFTNMAASEMKYRFYRLEKTTESIIFSTFHSIFFHILKEELNFKSSDILDTKTKYEFLRYSFRKNNINIDLTKELGNELFQKFFIIRQKKFKNLIKDYKINFNKDRAESNKYNVDLIYEKIFDEYEKLKEQYKKLDFEDMIFLTLKLFQRNKDILKKWQNKFEHILLDEAQDMNDMQYIIIKMLSNDNLFMVGDDDQSIYAFRGSNPYIMLSFKDNYKNAKLFYLEKNYRNYTNIVLLSKRLIENNKHRYKKDIVAVNKKNADIIFNEYDNLLDEARNIVSKISNKLKNNKNDTFGILARNRSILKCIMEELDRENIGYNSEICYDNTNKYIKILEAILEIASKNLKRKYFFLIFPIFNKKINKMYFPEENINFDKIIKNNFLDESSINFLKKLKSEIDMITNINPFALMIFINKIWKFDFYLNREKEYNKNKVLEAERFILFLLKRSKEFKKNSEFLKFFKLNKDKYSVIKNESENIFINTFHSLKGLEYDNVFVIGVSDGITPSYKSRTKEEIEEERRMFYVAITRAKKMLSISSVKNIGSKVYNPSRFIGEMMKED